MVTQPFDPLIDFDGMWTTTLAERYLPLPHVPAGKYECLDGRLVMSPHQSSQHSYAKSQLIFYLTAASVDLLGR
ncbi:hypothetical protein JOF53_004602 [Crossiella equi]|uniref:Restriction endonuclease domain-containing protein n=1 Tax=Crossiella equi TaxID=130796 RepID=A0ABS5AGP2_9PSEU|nr:hypothetical protein [Crossiella equi]MBP2475730.1 hypothetical protein [Crossiella equi]